eukprot:SAG31_NODE_288_length_18400_cov_55.018851_17_plen_97_part_00
MNVKHTPSLLWVVRSWQPGSAFSSVCGSRERPFLVFDDSMNPTHLVTAINSVCQGGDKDAPGKDWTYTSIQPVRLKFDDSDRPEQKFLDHGQIPKR